MTQGSPLSTREYRALGLVVRGLDDHAIAADLGVSSTSVRVILRGAYRKIGVTSRADAVSWGTRNGLSDV